MKEAKRGDGQIPLSELLPDDPEMAAILEETLAEAFAAGQAEKPEVAPNTPKPAASWPASRPEGRAPPPVKASGKAKRPHAATPTAPSTKLGSPPTRRLIKPAPEAW